MRSLLLLIFLALTACVVPNVARYGTKIIATNGCRSPQTTYALDVVYLNELGLAAWHTQSDLAQVVDVEVACRDFTSDCVDLHINDACGPQAGYFDLGTSVVLVDEGRANGEFAFSGVMNHELIHRYINMGPHPERAQMHICACGVHAAECWPNDCGDNNLMSPALSGLGTSTQSSWDGSIERFDTSNWTVNAPSDMDRRFVVWAVTP